VSVKRRWKIAIAVATLIAIVAAIALTTGEPEPEYNGRKLSYWVVDCTKYLNKSTDEARASSCVKAVQSIGTDAMPWLVEWIIYAPPHFPFGIERKIPFVRDRINHRALLQWGAYQMMLYLGTNAAPAVPLISKKLQKLPPSNSAQRLGRELLYLGPSGAIALALTNRMYLIKMAEMRYRDPKEPNRAYIEAALTHCLADPSPEIRKTAQESFQPIPIWR
jgi:hypothetical protein